MDEETTQPASDSKPETKPEPLPPFTLDLNENIKNGTPKKILNESKGKKKGG